MKVNFFFKSKSSKMDSSEVKKKISELNKKTSLSKNKIINGRKVLYNKMPLPDLNGKFEDKFKIKKFINFGSNSELYLTINNKTKIKYTCKIILRSKKNNSLNEIDILKIVDDDRILNIHKYEKYNDKMFIIYPYYKGPDVYYDLEFEDITENMLKMYIKEMALCIKVCYDKKIAHLDIKAENFLIKQRNPLRLVLIDFEFSKKITETKNKLKFSCGTIDYVAPEIINRYYTDKTDVWSLGAVAFYFFTGKSMYNKLEHKYLNLKEYFTNYKSIKISIDFLRFLKCSLQHEYDKRSNIVEILNLPWLQN